ncbi:Auxin responsive protein [Musa troglodytarum]|uniref:Auxin responsive protein n=2 Tax=Musa troglodytarum TaxID=320322 RepID=A0A9E7K3N2_9LILI|nr:Auxin responsive protein [Musa troglodytarum]
MDDMKANPKLSVPVMLQRVVKKWKKLAIAPGNSSKKLLQKTHGVPKGFLAVCVGEETERFVIPTTYLHHHAFRVLLGEAEEEFGFRQEGVLRMPCEVAAFERTLEMVQRLKKQLFCWGSSGR